MSRAVPPAGSGPRHSARVAVEAALRDAAPGVTSVEPGCWSVPVGRGGLRRASATLEGSWLDLTVPAAPLGRLAVWSALERNACLEGLAKVVANGKPGGLELRAEIPVDGGGFQAGVEATLRGLARALGEPDGGARPAPPADAAELCAAAGWPFEEKDGGSLSVVLEAGDVPCRARIAAGEAGHLEVTVPLPAAGDRDAVSREAMAVALLSAGGAVRMARPAAEPLGPGGRGRAWLEVHLPAGAGAGWLDRALAALSVACALCGSELDALRETEICQRYLRLRGHAPAALVRSGA